jgi:hypothetical protein
MAPAEVGDALDLQWGGEWGDPRVRVQKTRIMEGKVWCM